MPTPNELRATVADFVGRSDGEATAAAKTCFDDWLASRGGTADIEQARMLTLLPNYILRNQDKFDWWERATDTHKPGNLSKVGFGRIVDKDDMPLKSIERFVKTDNDWHKEPDENLLTEYYIFNEVFKNDICKGITTKWCLP